MAEKRYYWIKLKDDFFNLDTIDFLFGQEHGCEYIVLYQKLLLLTKNADGNLATTIGEMMIPYNAKKIARDTKFSIDTVIVGMDLFKKLGLIYEQENGILKIPYTEELIGSESSSAKRVREHRKNKALQCNTECNENERYNVTQEYRDKSIENRYIDIKSKEDKDYNARTQKKAYGKFKKVFLTDDEYNLLIEQFGNPEQLIKRLDEYKEQSGKQYNSDFMAIKKWVVEAVKEDEAKKPPIDETYDIDEIDRKAMLNDDYDI